MSRDQSSLLASEVLVAYRSRRCGGGPWDRVPAFYEKRVGIGSITLSDPNAPRGLTGQVLAIQTIRSTALAQFLPGANSPTNQGSLDALATQIAQDYFDWESSKFDVAYNGVIVPAASGLLDFVEWSMDSESMFTRLKSPGWNSYSTELQQSDGPSAGGCADNPGNGVYVERANSGAHIFEAYVPGGAVPNLLKGHLALQAGRLAATSAGADSTSCNLTCQPCSLPKENLTLTYGMIFCDGPCPTCGPFTVPMVWDSGNQWWVGTYNDGCTCTIPQPPLPPRFGTTCVGANQTYCWKRFKLYCYNDPLNGPTLFLATSYHNTQQDAQNGTNGRSLCDDTTNSNTCNRSIASSTCSPLMITFGDANPCLSGCHFGGMTITQ